MPGPTRATTALWTPTRSRASSQDCAPRATASSPLTPWALADRKTSGPLPASWLRRRASPDDKDETGARQDESAADQQAHATEASEGELTASSGACRGGGSLARRGAGSGASCGTHSLALRGTGGLARRGAGSGARRGAGTGNYDGAVIGDRDRLRAENHTGRASRGEHVGAVLGEGDRENHLAAGVRGLGQRPGADRRRVGRHRQGHRLVRLGPRRNNVERYARSGRRVRLREAGTGRGARQGDAGSKDESDRGSSHQDGTSNHGGLPRSLCGWKYPARTSQQHRRSPAMT